MAPRRTRSTRLAVLLSKLPRVISPGRPSVHILTLCLAALSLWLLTSFVGQIITSAQIDRRATDLQTEIAQLQSDNQHLATAVAQATSAAAAEQVAREQLGMAREGDTVLLPILPQATPISPQVTPAPLPTPQPRPNWRGWLQALFPTSPVP